jgi:hypothetical protein
VSGVQLRKCPLCLTPVTPGQLGFRDFSWLGDALPGKVAPMDFDGVLERNGHLLVMELKPKGVVVGRGQVITYRTLVRAMDADIWLIGGDPTDSVIDWAYLDKFGNWRGRKGIRPATLVRMMQDWWEAAA